jgi:hypothetical protein
VGARIESQVPQVMPRDLTVLPRASSIVEGRAPIGRITEHALARWHPDDWKEERMLAALSMGIFGTILVVVLIVAAIMYFVRRA